MPLENGGWRTKAEGKFAEIPAFSQPGFWIWLVAYPIQGEKVIGWEGRRGGGAKVLLGRGSELRE